MKNLFTGCFSKQSKLPQVCVLDLQEKIRSGCMNFQKKIDQAFKVKNLRAVILSITSTGGSPVQSTLHSKYIQELIFRHLPSIFYSFKSQYMQIACSSFCEIIHILKRRIDLY